jgi:hypothetical protein
MPSLLLFSVIKELHRVSPDDGRKKATHLVCKGAVKAVAPAARDKTAIDNFIVVYITSLLLTILCNINSNNVVATTSVPKRRRLLGLVTKEEVGSKSTPPELCDHN